MQKLRPAHARGSGSHFESFHAQARLLSYQGNPMVGTVSLMTFPDRGLAVAVATNVSHAPSVAPFGLKVAETFARPAGGGGQPSG